MVLASVTFSGKPEQVGGAQIPAIAFQKWCQILEVECDYLIWDQTSVDALNKYDGVFFCTTPTPAQVFNLHVPYTVMLHAEFDTVNDTLKDALAVIVTNSSYWTMPNQMLWAPPSLPEYLMTGDEEWYQYKEGLLYSARFTTWKNVTLLAGLTRYEPFLDKWGPVYVAGQANHGHYQDNIDLIDPNWTKITGLYNILDFDKTRAKHYQKDTYWEVFGTPKNRIQMPRLNLSAIEAMKFGLVPIIDKRSAPQHTHKYCIDVEDLGRQICTDDLRSMMLNMMPDGPYGYNAVKQQMENILEVFINGTTQVRKEVIGESNTGSSGAGSVRL